MKLTKTVKTLSLLSLLIWGEHCKAGEFPIDWRGIRQAGMGGSFTAVGNDETGVFYNPAGIARMRNPRAKKYLHSIEVLGLSVGGNSDAVLAIKSGLKSPKSWVPYIIDSAKNSHGNALYVESQIFPAAVMGAKNSPTILFGFPMRTENYIRAENPLRPEILHVVSKSQGGVALGIGSTSRGGLISWGISTTPNYRYLYDNSEYPTSADSIIVLKKMVGADAKKSTSLPITVGFMATAADFWLPTLGVSIHNIPTGCVDDYENPITGKKTTMCGSLRTGQVDKPEEKIDPTEGRVGFAITPRFRIGSQKVNLRLTGDFWPIPIVFSGKSYGLADLSVTQMLHAGAELYLGNALNARDFMLRAGTYDGSMSWGATISLGFIQLEYASYITASGLKELDSAGNPLPTNKTSLDRRHMLGISSRW